MAKKNRKEFNKFAKKVLGDKQENVPSSLAEFQDDVKAPKRQDVKASIIRDKLNVRIEKVLIKELKHLATNEEKKLWEVTEEILSLGLMAKEQNSRGN